MFDGIAQNSLTSCHLCISFVSCLSLLLNFVVTEAENIKKRWQEYTEELYKKDLHDPDNHDGVTTHLEPDILEVGLRKHHYKQS